MSEWVSVEEARSESEADPLEVKESAGEDLRESQQDGQREVVSAAPETETVGEQSAVQEELS